MIYASNAPTVWPFHKHPRSLLSHSPQRRRPHNSYKPTPIKLPPAGDNISSSSLSSDDEGDVPRHGHSGFPTQPRDTPPSHEVDGSEMLKIPSYNMPVSKTHHQQKGANWLTSTALVTWQNQRD